MKGGNTLQKDFKEMNPSNRDLNMVKPFVELSEEPKITSNLEQRQPTLQPKEMEAIDD